MRRALAALQLMVALTGCSPAATSSGPPTPLAKPTVTPDFARYVGAYEVNGHVQWVTNASGHLLNLRDSSFRQLYATAWADRFTYGPAFAVAAPKQADVAFRVSGGRAETMTLTPKRGRPISARRVAFNETEVRIPAHGATLAGTVTEPLSAGPHPGIVIIHGSEPGQRFYYGVWVGLYASLGFTVLSYDKRGQGDSTGTYPGEYASIETLITYADDASVALNFLAGWPGVDPHRVGFHGGSQGGWTVPLAIAQFHAPAAFAVLLSAPAVTVDQQGAWAGFSSSSTTLPSRSEGDMLAQVRAVPTTGYDPRPVLAQVRQPILWLNGAVDRQVPTVLNTEILQSFHRQNWDVEVLPNVDHGLLVNPSGLEPDEAKATHAAPGLADTIANWLATNTGSHPLS